MTEVVRREIVVQAPLEKAFTVFTERFGDIKPPEHNLLGGPITETVFEPRVGGHIYDRATDGSECRWARVLAYEPPHRVVFSWDIGPTWQLEADPGNASEVEVRFTAETPQRTRRRARAPQPGAARSRLGVRARRRGPRPGLVAVPGPLRGPAGGLRSPAAAQPWGNSSGTRSPARRPMGAAPATGARSSTIRV